MLHPRARGVIESMALVHDLWEFGYVRASETYADQMELTAGGVEAFKSALSAESVASSDEEPVIEGEPLDADRRSFA